MMAAPCEWDEACARARAPSPWNPLPGSTKAPAVTKCPEPSRAGLCGCSSGTALSARPAGWMDDGTPAVVKARLPVAAVHGAGRLDYENAGRRRCCRAIARLARRSVRAYCCTGVCKRTSASQRSIERRAARTGEPLSVRAGDRATAAMEQQHRTGVRRCNSMGARCVVASAVTATSPCHHGSPGAAHPAPLLPTTNTTPVPGSYSVCLLFPLPARARLPGRALAGWLWWWCCVTDLPLRRRRRPRWAC